MSINQNANTGALPDFRNLGILLRILVIVGGMSLAAALLKAEESRALMEELIDLSALVQPILLASLLALAAANSWLHRLRYSYAIGALLAIELAVTSVVYLFGLGAFRGMGMLVDYWLLTLFVTGVLIGYFDLRGRALSPALSEARLQALQARIRPHFLFNSLNAVLALIRRDPRRAERALEDLADLFRTLMSDARGFVRLADEIALLERYASLEQLRLGERLRFTWELDTAPPDALLPPLVLQPLLENAVYHGVEPSTAVADVVVRIERRGDRVHASIENPFDAEQQQRAGNRMALDNIRERLMLFFDAEARVATLAQDGRYRVEIEIPYKTERAGAAAAGT